MQLLFSNSPILSRFYYLSIQVFHLWHTAFISIKYSRPMVSCHVSFFPLFVFYLPARLQIYHSGRRNFLKSEEEFIEIIKSFDIENKKAGWSRLCDEQFTTIVSQPLLGEKYFTGFTQFWQQTSTKIRRKMDLRKI